MCTYAVCDGIATGGQVHIDVWLYRRYETYVWADQNEKATRKLPNDLIFPLRMCTFEGFTVPCPRMAEGMCDGTPPVIYRLKVSHRSMLAWLVADFNFTQCNFVQSGLTARMAMAGKRQKKKRQGQQTKCGAIICTTVGRVRMHP